MVFCTEMLEKRSNTSLKVAAFGRRTPQKRGAHLLAH